MNEAKDLLLNKYFDLTWEQYLDLQEAVKGMLASMSGSRHTVMIHLIDDKLRATEYGKEVFAQAERMLNGEIGGIRGAVFELNATAGARALRKTFDKWAWVRSVHVKLLYGLLQDPLMAAKWIVMAYGYQALSDLIEHGWIKGQINKGGHFTFTADGIAILNELGVVYDFVIDQE